MKLLRARHAVLDFLLPTDCFLCGDPVDAHQRLGACSECWLGIRPIRDPYCRRCGQPAPESTDLLGPARGSCATCVVDSADPADEVRAAVVYDARARGVLLRAKFGGRTELFRVLGDQVAAGLRAAKMAERGEWIVPVPSHPWADLRRGFSPAREIGRRVARNLELPFRPHGLGRRWIPWRGVKRLAKSQRRIAIRRAIVARRGFAGRRVLLVDDVMTTGATGGACVAALRQAGASEVRIAVWARAIRGQPT